MAKTATVSAVTSDPLAAFVAARSKAKPCKYARALAGMPADKSEACEAVMALPAGVQTTASIAEVLSGWGYAVGDHTIRRHRLGLCSCHQGA